MRLSRLSLCPAFGRCLLLGLCLLCLPWLAIPSACAEPAVDVSQTTRGAVELTPFLGTWTDAPAGTTIDEVQRATPSFSYASTVGSSIGFGYRRNDTWLRLRLDNPGNEEQQRVLELAYAHILEIDYFALRDGRIVEQAQVGSGRNLAGQAIAGRYPAFVLKLPPQTTTEIVFRLATHHPLIVPLRLWQPTDFADYVGKDWVIQAFYFGIAGGMLAFNVLLFIALRDRVYLLYVIWGLCIGMTIAIGMGIAKLYLWPESTLWARYANALFDNWSTAVLFEFVRIMLDLERRMPRINRMVRGLVGGFFILPVAYLVDFQATGELVLTLTVACGVGVLALAAHCARQGQRSAWIFLLAFGSMLAAGMIGSLWGLNLLQTSFWTRYGLQIGSAFEMILLALALADRFNESRRAVLQAQASALLAQENLVQTLRDSERVLDERVKARTEELQATLQTLQRAQADLVHSEKLASLGALVAGVAHELNTPIGNFLMTASTMEHEASALNSALKQQNLGKNALAQGLEKLDQMARFAVITSEKAAALISSFKRVAVDQTSEQRRAFDLHDVVHDVLASLQPSIRSRRIRIDVAVPEGLNCDSFPGPLGQVLTNLIQNAVTHAFPDPDQDGTIRVSAVTCNGDVELVVEDDGIGMEATVRSRAFDPFFTTRLGHGGSGLGLSIVANIVTGVLGGTIRLHAEPDSGCRFEVIFPVQAAASALPVTPP